MSDRHDRHLAGVSAGPSEDGGAEGAGASPAVSSPLRAGSAVPSEPSAMPSPAAADAPCETTLAASARTTDPTVAAAAATTDRLEPRTDLAPTRPAAPPAATASPAAAQMGLPQPRPAKRRVRKLVIAAVALLAVAGGATEGWHWWTVGRFLIETDDAYVAADTTVLAAKVAGYVTDVAVEDNTRVKAGDVIARIDDGDYRLAVEADQNRIATQQSTIDRIGEQVVAARASVDQSKAEVAAAEAELTRTAQVLDRQTKLAASHFASQQAVDTATAEHDRAVASLAGAKAALAAAEANVSVLAAQRTEAERTLAELKTTLAQAERDLSFTEVRAPVDGVVGNRAIRVGSYVEAGTRLAAIVPLDAVYVDANFKETQLGALAPGQKVEVAVDAFPDRPFEGVVASVAPASGSVFSLLPPENATGNFTKIVQRVPVRIRFSREALADAELRPGMSVIATVDTRAAAPAGPAVASLATR